MTKQISYGQLHRALLKLRFVETNSETRCKAYHHSDTNTLILLANRRPERFAREPEVRSVIRHVVEKGIAPQEELERLFDAVALP